MGYVLYGSKTSPFVRRIRLLMDELPHEFKEINVFDSQDAQKLKAINPINQVPVLTDGELTIWDSREIFNYLNSFHRFQNMDWQDENQLTAIDGLMAAGINLMMMKRLEIDISGPEAYFTRQRERMASILDHLKPTIQSHCLKNWDFHTMSLFSFLEWAQFRNILDLSDRPECLALIDHYKTLPAVIKTEIPKA